MGSDIRIRGVTCTGPDQGLIGRTPQMDIYTGDLVNSSVTISEIPPQSTIAHARPITARMASEKHITVDPVHRAVRHPVGAQQRGYTPLLSIRLPTTKRHKPGESTHASSRNAPPGSQELSSPPPRSVALKTTNRSTILPVALDQPVAATQSSKLSADNTVKQVAKGAAKRDVYPKKFVIDHIVGHRYKPTREIECRVRWFSYPPSADTDEPVDRLPQSKIVQYHRREKTGVPANIDNALVG
ncbi:hypothetical protein BWQ96_06982 [Gracilariopsis chorda]|uniref:Chromo domain-containing protein n=1 Tax=Gracilariopsis chorda TaxID=448386 RepID=A0A2V3IMH8_9FLOR|nr:hypothetical protein BWQ96_06982 [Gracilariopsis chorda]|eukprot:PXF43285.1 hypothetical protein BWQ96_06982 [Gracilariopsis chorda]